MFRPVSSKVSFPQVEENILKLWQEENVFEQSIARRQGGPTFILYDGPPTVNGSPALHHVLTSVFKDVIPRYKAMKGFYTPRLAGWDTHGLPVELEIEKQLGFSSKTQIEEYGIARFNELCRKSVGSYIREFEKVVERIGYWVSLENAYVTMRNEYVESCWWAIKQMWDKGLVYQGYKVTPHCPRCGTSLSSHEVALGYQDDVADPSVYIKFKVTTKSLGNISLDKPAYFLAWTTTPWTLPGNTALAVAADADYAIVEVGDEYLIVADALRERVGLGDHKVIATLKGSDLRGVSYEALFNPHEYGIERRRPKTFFNRDVSKSLQLEEPKKNLTYSVIVTDFVSMEDGTGIVHIAPAYGEVDYQAMFDEEPWVDFVHMVDLQGNITGNYPFSGKFVKDADKDIIADLQARGLLFRSETIRHTYPFCWRCESPLLYYAKQTWYIRTTAVKERLIAGNAGINWYPEHIKYGRFGDWLNNNVDWAFSRERYWGTPLPVWQCQSCKSYECVGSLEELEKKSGFAGLKKPLDLHRPFVDEITFDCPQCGANMRRLPEVIDCWFDSGAMPIAQYHYPFEKGDIFKDGRFPSDYICEAVDQTRGWFYSLHAISTLLFDRICYRNVICLGLILDAKGEKMSKSKGNVVWPWEVINKYGADALRWYFFTSSPPGNARRFDEKMVAEVTRRFLLTLWNVYSFFVTYANIDQFTPGAEVVALELSELDRWVISELNQLIVDVDSALDGYNPTDGGRKIEDFVDELSNWYVRRSRRRFWKSENDVDKLAAYHTLYQCLVTLSKLLAPFTPFLAEELYQNLARPVSPDAPESVHLADFPVADKSQIDRQLGEDVRLAMKVSSLGRAARSQAGVKVRQPLAHVKVSVASNREQESLERLKPQVLEELNVKELGFGTYREIAELNGHGYVVSGLEQDVDPQKGYKVLTGGGVYLVAVSTDTSPELQAEGMAREIVHWLQTMRRSAGFDIADYIVTYYDGNDYIKRVMADFADYIRQETLSRQLGEGIPGEGVFTESYKLGDHEIKLAVKKLG